MGSYFLYKFVKKLKYFLAINMLSWGVIASAIASPSSKPAFSPAETLSFECKYLGIPVGKASILVGSPTYLEDQTIWPITGVGKTNALFALYPIKDKFTTWWDPSKHLTIGNDLLAVEKNKRRRERVRFHRNNATATTIHEKKGEKKKEYQHSVPPSAQDLLAAIFMLREQRLAIGDQVEIPIFTGRRLFTLKARVDRKEVMEVPAGKFNTVVLRIRVEFSGKLANKRDLNLYLTDDFRHLPVRMDAEFIVGSLVADLASYREGISLFP
jgi:hypothetical protein